MISKVIFHPLLIFILLMVSDISPTLGKSCDELLLGQYRCVDNLYAGAAPHEQSCKESYKDPGTFLSGVPCYPAPNITCGGVTYNGTGVGFQKYRPCTPVGDKRFDVALLLSIFLGMFGVDRFYLGYPALGLLKLSTFGFLLVGQLLDIILIATQVVKPADGTDYIIDFYGAKLTPMNDSLFEYYYG